MKKIFTLAFGLLLTVALFAADHRPQVVLNSARNFQVMIDGQMVNTQGRTVALNHLYNGRHTIKVFEVKRSFFGTQRRMVSQSSFRLRGNDLKIRVGYDGDIMFKESRNLGRNDRNWNNDDYGWNRSQDNRDDRNDRDFRYNQNDRNDRDQRDRNDRDRQYDRD